MKRLPGYGRPVAILVLVLFLSGCLSRYGGGLSPHSPLAMKQELSAQALQLVNDAYAVGGPVVDRHLHLIGYQTPIKTVMQHFCPGAAHGDLSPDAVAWINEDRFSLLRHPLLWAQTRVLMDTMKIAAADSADIDSIQRLLDLVQGLTNAGTGTAAGKAPPYDLRIFILAIDGHYRKGATQFDPDLTDMVIANDYVVQLADCMNRYLRKPGLFEPVISVNPYRADAVAELTRFKGRIRYIKWVAPAMGFDPSDAYNDPFYRAVRDFGMVIISHAGAEHAFDVKDDRFRRYGNPLLMRRALDFGIPVILSHAGGYDDNGSHYENYRRFMQLMRDERNRDDWCLFGDISALTIDRNFQHFGMFSGPDAARLRYRLLYGSDYPLPASGFLYPLDKLIDSGYLPVSLHDPLAQIFSYNPLAFDVTVKRLITVVDAQGRRSKPIPKDVFLSLEDNIRREFSDPQRPDHRRRQCQNWYTRFIAQASDMAPADSQSPDP